MPKPYLSSPFLHYLACNPCMDAQERLPALNELSKELGISVAALREQLEVARALGLVEVRPRTGTRRLPYTFFPAVQHSLSYAIEHQQANFLAFADLRNHLEAAYWHEAVNCLTPDDHAELSALVGRAWEKLKGSPIQIPHAEHRQLHLIIYGRMGNIFVMGLLEAYWDAYEGIGLNTYAEYNYLKQVWEYHQQMVDAIIAGDYDAGYRYLVEHKEMIHQMPVPGAVAGHERI